MKAGTFIFSIVRIFHVNLQTCGRITSRIQ